MSRYIAISVTATVSPPRGDGCYLHFVRARYPSVISPEPGMPKPVIFTISAASDEDASVWSGHCHGIPAAADAPTLDGLLEKSRRCARSAAGQSCRHRSGFTVFANHGVARSRADSGWNGAAVRSAVAEDAARRGCTLVRQGKGSHEIWHSPITKRNLAVPIGIPSRHTANAICGRQDCRRRFEQVERQRNQGCDC